MWGNCVEGMWRLSGRCVEGAGVCGDVVCRLKQGCVEDVGKLSGGHEEAVWRVWGSYLEDKGRLSGRCGEAVWRVKPCCLQCAGKLSGGCVEVGKTEHEK